jgi:Flp pilus assembly protein TadD/SAM-dependent methyltransferase
MNRKERRAAQKGRVAAPSGEAFAQALSFHQAGRLDEAESLYRQILAREPRHADATQLLGVLTHQKGQHDAAIALIDRAIALNPKAPQYHANRGQILRTFGRLAEAEASYAQAIALKPDYLDALMGLGVIAQAQGKSEPAIKAYRRALALKPDIAEAHNNLGNALEDTGRLADAVASYERAVALRPRDPGMLYNLAAALLASGDSAKALAVARQALALGETSEIKMLLGNCLKELRSGDVDPALRLLVARAVSEPWGRPQEVVGAAMLLITAKLPATLDEAAADELLCRTLETVPVADVALERVLTRLRRDMLVRATATGGTADVDARQLVFCCALARQCFINEYVFDVAADEAVQAARLRDELDVALARDGEIAPLNVAIVAAYFPLHRVPDAERLLSREFPAPVNAVLTQQWREPAAERQLAETMPHLTPVADRVSRLVREQYEANPYPRWVKPTPIVQPTTLDAFLGKRFPSATFRPLNKRKDLDILVAGCGTGQHSIETARLFAASKLLAIDLSGASLAYAKRQTAALGLANIEYAQADILALHSLERRFDLIEASGVLHHLGDPMAGWRVLLSLLRPGGVMSLGFYSELARQDVVAARGFIAEHGFGDSAEEIRRARQAMIAAGEDAPFASLTRAPDFFSTSACRDLLFHVQEHRLTIPDIATFLTAEKLRFVGFDLDGRTMARYRARFPADRTATDLASWHHFETENPLTFRAMYQFWVQKEG